MAKKTKILYIVTLSEWGGAQRYIFDLVNNLDKNQYDIVVAAGEGDNQLFDRLAELKVRLHRIKMKRSITNPSRWLSEFSRIYLLIRQEKPDIVHLNSSKTGVIGAFSSFTARFLPPRVPHKLIYTVHGFAFNQPMSKLKRKIYLLAEKISAPLKDKIICVSEFDQQLGIKNKIAKKMKLITIHNGIDLKSLNFLTKEEAKKKLGLSASINIGTIANFYPTKDLPNFIEAGAEIVKKFPGINFFIIGDGQLRDELEEKIKELNLEKNFILVGKKRNASQYLKAFDIYVCSSVKEGFPYSILEAMAAELPIVSTNVGGIPEMIKDNFNGLLIEPKKPKVLAQAIINLINDPEKSNQLAANAGRKVKEKFSLNKMLQKTLSIYE